MHLASNHEEEEAIRRQASVPVEPTVMQRLLASSLGATPCHDVVTVGELLAPTMKAEERASELWNEEVVDPAQLFHACRASSVAGAHLMVALLQMLWRGCFSLLRLCGCLRPPPPSEVPSMA